MRVRSGGAESAGSGVVDEVVGAVGVAPEVDAGEGLLDLPTTEGLDAVVVDRHRAVVAHPGLAGPDRGRTVPEGDGVVDLLGSAGAG